jgi:hypothetical protein
VFVVRGLGLGLRRRALLALALLALALPILLGTRCQVGSWKLVLNPLGPSPSWTADGGSKKLGHPVYPARGIAPGLWTQIAWGTRNMQHGERGGVIASAPALHLVRTACLLCAPAGTRASRERERERGGGGGVLPRVFCPAFYPRAFPNPQLLRPPS